MKLAQLYNKTSIFITFAILIIAGGIYFIAISYISNAQLDHDLTEEIEEVTDYANAHHRMPDPVEFDEDQTSFQDIGQLTIRRRFTDTPFIDSRSGKVESGRAVVGTVRLNNKNYKVVIAESKESTEYLVQIIGFITMILAVLLIAAVFFTNKYILKGLWKPFYSVLSQLKAFTITGNIQGAEDEIKVEEFKELRDVVYTMADRAVKDYQTLKSFTENASHEMMTPIAVMTSKLDLLIQDESLNESQYEQLSELYIANNRLSKLNQSLLLLVKIDNRQINDVTEIDLKRAIEEKIKQFTEILKNKELNLKHTLQNKSIKGSVYLIDILLNNLFGNAIRHNVRGGQITITLNDKTLTFENTGKPDPLDGTKIFDRFAKDSSSEGTGLGLAIAKNICLSYNFDLTYQFKPPLHCFTVTF